MVSVYICQEFPSQEFEGDVCQLCVILRVRQTIEQPSGSMFFRHPAMVASCLDFPFCNGLLNPSSIEGVFVLLLRLLCNGVASHVTW